MTVNIYKDAEELTTAAAEWITDQIRITLKHSPRFTIALSGGNTPKQLFAKLASDSFSQKIDWSKLHIFWGDERVVPFTDKRNNANMAFSELLSKVAVPENQIHVMRTDIPPNESALEYEKILHEYFDDEKTSFNLVLLGLGEDGHTLSLFPGIELPSAIDKWVTSIYVSAQNMSRITLLPSIVNKAVSTAFMVTGEAKAKIVHEILHSDNSYPAKLIQPADGGLYWFLDEAAAIVK